jgi:hypothetical protein
VRRSSGGVAWGLALGIKDAPGTSGLRNAERSAKRYADVLQERYGGSST